MNIHETKARSVTVVLPGPITCDEIVALIREKYDPQPEDWPRHRSWDDGAKEIADEILARRAALPEEH